MQRLVSQWRRTKGPCLGLPQLGWGVSHNVLTEFACDLFPCTSRGVHDAQVRICESFHVTRLFVQMSISQHVFPCTLFTKRTPFRWTRCVSTIQHSTHLCQHLFRNKTKADSATIYCFATYEDTVSILDSTSSCLHSKLQFAQEASIYTANGPSREANYKIHAKVQII